MDHDHPQTDEESARDGKSHHPPRGAEAGAPHANESTPPSVDDVSRNWEPYPEFGQYQGLATLDRGTPLLRPPSRRQGDDSD
jgi:hypothetical protein